MTPSTNPTHPGDRTLVWAGLVIVLAVLGCFVYLTVSGHGDSTTEMLSFVTPVVAALLIARQVSTEARRQDVVIEKIAEQTNGVLDGRIRAGVAAELEAHGVTLGPDQP